ncbi:MAG: DedA family protein [Patescibacteria group bacterium]
MFIQLLEIILHIDEYLGLIINTYGSLIYSLLFLIIFVETGLVVMPFLPGDSLLFAAGTFAAIGLLHFYLTLLIFCLAAVLGDSVNYWLGKKFGRKLFTRENSWFFNQGNLKRAENFYEKHGAKTIILARFIPIIRTFAPFVAGMGKMKYPKFLAYNIFGGIIWVLLFFLTGYFFGNISWVKENFSLAIMAIIVISLVPILVELLRRKLPSKK